MIDKPDKFDLEYMISQYIDGLLDAKSAAALEKRIADDPAVAEEFHRYAALQTHLEQWCSGDDTNLAAQKQSIMAAVERAALIGQRPRRLISLRPVMRMASVAALVAIIATAAVLVLTRGRNGAASEQVVVATLMPAAEKSIGEPIVDVYYPAPEIQMLRLAMPEAPGASAMPAGTIVAGIGDASGKPARAFPFPMELAF